MEQVNQVSQAVELLAAKSTEKISLEAIQNAPVPFSGILNTIISSVPKLEVEASVNDRATSAVNSTTDNRNSENDSTLRLSESKSERSADDYSKDVSTDKSSRDIGVRDRQAASQSDPNSSSKTTTSSADNAATQGQATVADGDESVQQKVLTDKAPAAQSATESSSEQGTGIALGQLTELVDSGTVDEDVLQEIIRTAVRTNSGAVVDEIPVDPTVASTVPVDEQVEVQPLDLKFAGSSPYIDPASTSSSVLPQDGFDLSDIEQFVKDYGNVETKVEQPVTPQLQSASLSSDIALGIDENGNAIIPSVTFEHLVSTPSGFIALDEASSPTPLLGQQEGLIDATSLGKVDATLAKAELPINPIAVLETGSPQLQTTSLDVLDPSTESAQLMTADNAQASLQNGSQQQSSQQGTGQQTSAAPSLEGVQGPGPAPGGSQTFLNQLGKAAAVTESRQLDNINKIAAMIKNSGNRMKQSFSLNLTPAQLGSVRVDMNIRGNTLHLNIVTENGTASHVLQANAQELKAALADSGIQLGEFDVSSGLSNSNSQGNGNQSSGFERRGNSFSSSGFGIHTEEFEEHNLPIPARAGVGSLDLVA